MSAQSSGGGINIIANGCYWGLIPRFQPFTPNHVSSLVGLSYEKNRQEVYGGILLFGETLPGHFLTGFEVGYKHFVSADTSMWKNGATIGFAHTRYAGGRGPMIKFNFDPVTMQDSLLKDFSIVSRILLIGFESNRKLGRYFTIGLQGRLGANLYSLNYDPTGDNYTEHFIDLSAVQLELLLRCNVSRLLSSRKN